MADPGRSGEAPRPLNYTVRLAPAAEKFLEKLRDKVLIARLTGTLRSLAAVPRPSGCKKLMGASDLYRVRVGEYRIVYEVRDTVLLVLVLSIGHRRDIYR